MAAPQPCTGGKAAAHTPAPNPDVLGSARSTESQQQGSRSSTEIPRCSPALRSHHIQGQSCPHEPHRLARAPDWMSASWDVPARALCPRIPAALQPSKPAALRRGKHQGGQGRSGTTKHHREPKRLLLALLPVAVLSQFTALRNAMGIHA